MKRIAKRTFILWALLIVFFAGVGFMTYSLVKNADEWVTKPFNRHLYSGGQLTIGGTIYDTEGVELIKNEDSKREYNDDVLIRKATLHTVGDRYGSIASGVQTVYSKQLTGYSFIDGVYNIKKLGGNDIHLTIDSEVCKYAFQKLNGRKGTIGIMNYKTGDIVCMTSSPSYDPDNIPKDIDTNEKYDGAYVNRLIKGLYAPGSTFKTVVALCAIENIPDIFERTWTCEGEYKASDGTIICNATHGKIDFEKALAKSCNSVFAQIAIELGAEKLTETVNRVGLTSSSDINGIKTAQGVFNVNDNEQSALGWAGIGQGTVMMNPLQMLRFIGAVANEGVAVTPTIIKSVKTPLGLPTLSSLGSTKSEKIMDADDAASLKAMMRNNVKTQYGESNYKGLNLCAKSGTAQINGKDSTAWFIAFMDDSENPYAVIVAVEEGGSGSQVAGPIAGAVLKKLVNSK